MEDMDKIRSESAHDSGNRLNVQQLSIKPNVNNNYRVNRDNIKQFGNLVKEVFFSKPSRLNIDATSCSALSYSDNAG